MARYMATINVPGYLPMDDDPPVFDRACDAWQYLADECARGQDESEAEEYSDTFGELCARSRSTETLAHGDDGTGTIYGATPGYDGDHDLGLAYCVTLV